MKRISKLSLFLMLIAMMAAFVPAAFAEEPACPDGLINVGTVEEPNCIPDVPPVDPCLSTGPCVPPVDPCLSTGPCVPPVDPCLSTGPCVPPIDPCLLGGECCAPGILPCTPEVTPETPVVTTPAPAAPVSEDGKGISFNDADLGVSLYVSEDENGAPMLEIYETQNQTDTGNYAVTVSQDDLAQYVENLPAENVLLKAAGHIRVYILTTGEISVFVGPDSEGKVHVKVFNGIPWTNVYGFTIDPV